MKALRIDEKTEMNTLLSVLDCVLTEMYCAARDLGLEEEHERLEEAVQEFNAQFRSMFEEDV